MLPFLSHLDQNLFFAPNRTEQMQPVLVATKSISSIINPTRNSPKSRRNKAECWLFSGLAQLTGH